ncbi:Indole-3-acetic acid-amido synthetase GH3-3 [Nymphaea thermarum]|nr:Indole-3-acetic acid-amido synthetase GH3-3 [Nymphaea thermarum]
MASESDERYREALKALEEVTGDVDGVQERVLAEILSTNANTEYLHRHGLAGRTDRRSFKSNVPVIQYEDILPDIRRIAYGDSSPIFSAKPISEFLISSGTSGGERKMIPVATDHSERIYQVRGVLLPAVLNKFVPGLNKGKALYFLFMKAETKSPAGIPMRPILTSYYRSSQFLLHEYPSIPHTSPIASIFCTDVYQSMYSQMLFGLAYRLDILCIGAVFAPIFLRAMNFLEQNFHDLADDLEHGTVNARITDEAVRAALEAKLTSDPENAAYIRNECSTKNWQGIIRRIWPEARFLDVIVTGAMAQYIPSLEFYSGGLPLASTAYASSESFFGINLNPLCKTEDIAYTIMPNIAYFEFQTYKSQENGGQGEEEEIELVDLANVEVGKEYELVVTTYSGLYRCKIGDVLRVVRFYNKAPEFKFVGRKNVCLSLESDKVEEIELQNAIATAESTHLTWRNTRVLQYSCYTDVKTVPGHYILYWELSSMNESENFPQKSIIEQCCLTIEESLNSVYRSMRAYYKNAGPLEIKIVKNGTFEELMENAIAKGSSADQYKPSRCVKSTAILELLDARVVSNCFSPGVPSWSPVPRHF